MTQPILEPGYWKERLERATKSSLHHAVFHCTEEAWLKIRQKHTEILARTIKAQDSIFDAGCGWGRLLDLLPMNWRGSYLGCDLSPDFIAMARAMHSDRTFFVGDLREANNQNPEILNFFDDSRMVIPRFDWAIFISIRPMIYRNLGKEFWWQIEEAVRTVADKILILEYDPNDEGEIL